jgi:hypothetical protein
VSSKTGIVVSNETIQIIDATESRDTLQIINEDGEPGLAFFYSQKFKHF